ncbi:formate dehydrogenase accessory sulfurtransferase FdhD [Acidovorax sp. DW039]|nr:formate dehydrogenase accessory sulfurtransferase FdhD [Acidovorax sp. DW039]
MTGWTDVSSASCAELGNRIMEAALPQVAARKVRVFGEQGLSDEGEERPDWLSAEVPVAMVFNGVSHAVMMATPDQLEEFALGFALSEGIIDHMDDCRGVDVCEVESGSAALPHGVGAIEVRMDIAARCFERLKARRRTLAGRTGCGVCGVENLAALDLVPEQLPAQPWHREVDVATVLQAFDGLQMRQRLNAQAGSLHAAGWARLDGQLLFACEDVGRHNALDKLIGYLAKYQNIREPGFVVLTSRGSHELVRKCVRVGISALATISAPTATGVQLADLAGMRLWGLCRAPRAVLYTPGRGVTAS